MARPPSFSETEARPAHGRPDLYFEFPLLFLRPPDPVNPGGGCYPKKSATNNWCFASLGVIIHYFHSKNEGPPLKNTSSWILLDLALVFPITAEMKRNTGPTSWNPGLENLWRFIDVQWHCQQRQHENPWCVEALMSNVVVCSAMAAMASQNHPKNHRKSKQVRSFWIFHQCN